MKRTNQPHPLAILTGDWHLRETIPRARTDDFLAAQTRKLEFVQALQKEHGCPVIHSGDLFDHWKPSPWLISYALRYLPEQFWTIYGNHDLPQHSLELADRCGIDTLKEAGKVWVMPEIHWGQDPVNLPTCRVGAPNLSIQVWHIMTYKGKTPWPGCTDPEASTLLNKTGPDLLLTGHNHQAFVVEKDGRILVNPGSLTRQNADQGEHRPRVYLWYPDNTVKAVYLPCEQDVLTREHLVQGEAKERRYEAFISRLKQEGVLSLSFQANLEAYFKDNKTSKVVEEFVWAMYPGGE